MSASRRRRLFTRLALAGLMALAGCSTPLSESLAEATASVAQTLCSKIFVSGLPPERVLAEHLAPEPGLGLVLPLLTYQVDPKGMGVRASLLGATQESTYAKGRGCTLSAPGAAQPAPMTVASSTPQRLPPAAPDATVIAPITPALSAALASAFADAPGRAGPRNTHAVLVVHRGRIIGERYADGIGPHTPLLAHSLSKSILATLIGQLIVDGRLRLDQPAPIAAWAEDGRSAITIEHLLRMNAGFGVDEGSGASIATRMWFLEPDAAAYAIGGAVEAAPGAQWRYSSRAYMILSRIAADAIGGGPQGFADFAVTRLFGPIGMTDVQLQFDAAGTPMGAHAFFASARDWAQFGLLYLQRGMADGVRLLPDSWTQTVSQPTLNTGYGAGFWLARGNGAIPVWGGAWGLPDAPSDAFFGRGYMGQYVIIVPSRDLVLVRLGNTHWGAGDIAGANALLRDVLAALPAG